jgi:hypothetical protein
MSDHYWLLIGNENKGPYTFSQLESMWKTGSITADTLYCQEGFEAWLPASSLLDKKPTVTEQGKDGSEKRILPALILCLFLGLFGAHAFYARRWKQGISIIVCLLGPVFWFFAPFIIPLLHRNVQSPASPTGMAPDPTYWISSQWFVALCFLLPGAAVVHVIYDLVRILVGSYKDGQGLKITKWT